MEVIIIAAVALLVLVILATLVLKSWKNVDEGTTCASGTCRDSCDTGELEIVGGGCTEPQVCCSSSGANTEG